jgi:hypothetical protein
MDRDRQGKVTPGKRGPRLSKARLDELVKEALMEAYGESEQAAGFYRRPTRCRLPEGQGSSADLTRRLAIALDTSRGERVDRCVSVLADRSHVNARARPAV